MDPLRSHIFFADDGYIFCKASRDQALHISNLLTIFERASGQKINVRKSSVVFSRNVERYLKDEVCGILQFAEAEESALYLGLPNFIGRNKYVLLGYLKDKVKSRIQSWDEKYLSRGGK